MVVTNSAEPTMNSRAMAAAGNRAIKLLQLDNELKSPITPSRQAAIMIEVRNIRTALVRDEENAKRTAVLTARCAIQNYLMANKGKDLSRDPHLKKLHEELKSALTTGQSGNSIPKLF